MYSSILAASLLSARPLSSLSSPSLKLPFIVCSLFPTAVSDWLLLGIV